MSDRSAWTVVRLKKPRKSGRFLHAFLKKRPGIRTLVFDDLTDSGLGVSSLQIMLWNTLPNLNRVHLGSMKPPYPQEVVADIRKRTNSTPVHLSFRGSQTNVFIPPSLREHIETLDFVADEHIESLHFVGDFLPSNTPDGMLPHLKRLRLSSKTIMELQMVSD